MAKVPTKRTGDAGLNEYAINTNRTVEYLDELQGRDGSLVYRQMSKGDPIVGMILRVHKNPIRSAAWSIPYPSDATDEEKFAIDLIRDELFGESGSEFDTFLNKALTMIEYGFSVFEQYYKPVKFGVNTYLLPVLEQRTQTSIQDVFPDKGYIRQITIDSGVKDIPFENLVFFIVNQQGEDMRGESLLRNAYRTYKDKKTYKEWLGIGIQRSVAGVPAGKVPKGTQPDSDDYIAFENLLKNIGKVHEEAYMIYMDGYEFTIHESKFNAEPVQKAIDSCNSEMALSVLAQFIMLGQMDNSGAYALSRDQSDFFLDGLQYIVNLVCGVVNEQVINKYLKINFGDKIDPSRVVLYGKNLNKKAGKELSEVLNTLSASGFIKATVDDEVQLRSNLEMPKLSEDEINRRMEARGNPLSPQPAPAVPVKLSESSVRASRSEYIQNTNKEMSDFMTANLLLIKDKLMADIESTLKRGTVEINGLKNIEISSEKYLKGLQIKLSTIAQESWLRAKSNAKVNNVKLAETSPKDITDKALKAFVLNQAQSITDKQAAALLNQAILTASNSILKGMSISQAVSNTGKSIDSYIASSGVTVDGSLIVVGTANFGEHQFNKEIKDQLWGYIFVNDDPISDICQWYNGKTFSVDSAEMSIATPPLHPNCKSYLEPIYKSVEVDKPEINDTIAPPSVMAGKTIF